MGDLEFLVLAALLTWLLWRTRVVAQTSPWLRDALLRRLFKQLDEIQTVQINAPPGTIEQQTENWWRTEMLWQAEKRWIGRRRCGPWCHRDWQTPGIDRAVEIEHEVERHGWKSEESKKEEFERATVLAEHYPFELAVLYASGWGVASDQNEALRWYRKAAEEGDRRAQYSLASAYYEGDAVPVDHATAYFWLKVSEMGRGVDAVGDLLTPEQRSDIEQRCRTWIKSRSSSQIK